VSERIRSSLSEKEPFLVQIETGLAITVAEQGRPHEAIPILRRAAANAKAIFPPRHPTILYAQTQLGALLTKMEKWADAEAAYSETLEAHDANPDKTRNRGTEALNGFALSVEMQGQPARAESRRREMVELARDGDPPEELASTLANLGRNLLMQQRWADAEPVIREALDLRRKAIKPDGPSAWQITSTTGMLGEALLGRALTESSTTLFAEAEPLIIEAAQLLPADSRVPKTPAGMPDRKREALERAVRLYTAWHAFSHDDAHAEKSAEWQRRLDEYNASQRVQP